VEALGFSEVPTARRQSRSMPTRRPPGAVVGDRAQRGLGAGLALAQQMLPPGVAASMSGQASEEEPKELQNLIAQGRLSRAALRRFSASLEQLPQGEVQVRCCSRAPGEITRKPTWILLPPQGRDRGLQPSIASGAKKAGRLPTASTCATTR